MISLEALWDNNHDQAACVGASRYRPRGLMKTFGLVVPKGKGRIFEANVRRLLDEEHALAAVVLPILEAWRAIRNRAAELDRLLLRSFKRARRGCLGWAHAPEVPVGRNGLRSRGGRTNGCARCFTRPQP
jgi:hypothetical protein